jgi:hypothetical protein
MISHGTLINHCGARPVTKGDLELIPAPPPTATWFPIRHLDVLDTVEHLIQESGFTFRSMQLSVTADHKRFFGVLDLHSPIADGVCLSVGVRNSNDKTFPIGFCIGNRTFVCDNLAFSSQVVLSKRHTRFGEDRFREGIAAVIAKLNDYKSLEARRIERLQSQELSNDRADAVVLRAWDAGIVGTRLLRPLLDQWRQPAFPDFVPRTAWSLLSAYTYIAKDRQKRYPNQAAIEAMQFQDLLAA